jgi:hypothetical protein
MWLEASAEQKVTLCCSRAMTCPARLIMLEVPPVPHVKQGWSYMNKLRVLVADDQVMMKIPHKLDIFRWNSFDW